MALHISSENNRALCGRISDDCLSQAFAEKVTCKTCAKIWARHYRHVATGPAEGRLFHTACGRKVNPFSQGPELPECSKCFPVEMSPTVAMDNTHRVAAEIASDRGTPTRGVGVADYASEPRRFRSRNGKRKVFVQRHRSHRRGW